LQDISLNIIYSYIILIKSVLYKLLQILQEMFAPFGVFGYKNRTVHR
jgi:hypothetical protein